MTLRTGHGKGAGRPHVEVLPVDELPAGVAALKRLPAPDIDRDARGRPATPADAREMGRRGGLARRGQTRLGHQLGLHKITSVPAFRPYASCARAFAKHTLQELAQQVGGGLVGALPASMVQSAALQLAASRFLFDRAQFAEASRLANDSRQNLAAAWEYTAKTAKARPAADPHAALEAEFGERDDEEADA